MGKKIIGIVGGMGPEATADLFMKIIKATPAEKDQDHLRVIIDNNTNIPDRTKAILGQGVSPVTEIKSTVSKLRHAGADILVMPCNTAHYFYDSIVTDEKLVFLHMMRETVKHIVKHYPKVKKVGILATSGTITTRMYHQALEAQGLIPITPEPDLQDKVMEAIYSSWGIKAGKYAKARQYLIEVGNELMAQGAEAIIMGCTEIPLAMKSGDVKVPLIDATLVLAQSAVELATS